MGELRVTSYSIDSGPYVEFVLIVVGILALIGNTITILLVAKSKPDFRTFSWELIITLAAVNILTTIVTLIMGGFHLAYGSFEVYKMTWYCDIFGSLTIWSTELAYILVSTLALDRFMVIFYHRHLSATTGWKVVFVLILIISTAMILSLVKGGFHPDPTHTHCWLNRDDLSSEMATILSALVFTVSLIMIIGLYTSIAIYLYRESLRNYNELLKTATWKVSAIIFCYLLCLIPKIISIGWATIDADTHPEILNILAPIGLGLVTGISPLLVLGIHTRYNKRALKFLSSGK